MTLNARIGPHRSLWATAYTMLAAPPAPLSLCRRYVTEVEGRSVSIACIGRRERFAPFLARLFDVVRLDDGGCGRRLRRGRRGTAVTGDLVAVALHPGARARFQRDGWTVVPEYVHWRAGLTDVPPERPGRSLRRNLRRVRVLEHELELVSHPTPSDLREFRVDMAEPLARTRFGVHAWVPSPALFRRLGGRCELLFVRVGGQRVAGQMIVRHRDEALGLLLGVRDGDPSLVRAGVQSALYAALLDHARRSGARSVDVGRTLPFVRDGVAAYKRQWGFAPHCDPMSPQIALRADLAHPGVRWALEREPLLTLTDDGFGRLPG
jgi:hypothetical protein